MNMILLGMGGTLFILAIFCVGVFILINKESRSRMNPVGPSAPVQATKDGAPSWFSKSWKYVLGAVVIIAVLYMLDTNAPSALGMSLTSLKALVPSRLAVALILVGILAILGATGKGGLAGKIALGFVAVVLIWYLAPELYNQNKYGKDANLVRETMQERNAKNVLAGITEVSPIAVEQKPDRVVTQSQARWADTKKGGPLPVGVWSEPERGTPGCSVSYTEGGYGFLYAVQYRYQDEDWKDQKIGTSPNVSEFRFKILKDEGLERLSYTKTCS